MSALRVGSLLLFSTFAALTSAVSGCGAGAPKGTDPKGTDPTGTGPTDANPTGPAPKGANIWWVSKAGDDANSGRSLDAAFATFHKALTSMGGGDTLYIDDGVYTDTIGAFGGDNFSPWSTDQGKDGLSSSQRTKILGYHPHAVIVDGGGTVDLDSFKFLQEE